MLGMFSCSKKISGASLKPETAAVYEHFKKSTLVVRIPTRGKKISVLESRLANVSDPGDRDKLRKTIEDAISDDNLFFDQVRSAFTKHFTFIPVVYIPDSLYAAFLIGDNTVFYDKDRRRYTVDNFDREKYYTIIQAQQKEQLRMVDKFNLPVPAPLPYRKKLNKFLELSDRQSFLNKQVYFFNRRLKELSI
jgi:hypothetical protein